MDAFGHVRIAAGFAETHVGNPDANADALLGLLKTEPAKSSAIVLFPELCVTGYTCGDLFQQPLLLDAAWEATRRIAASIGAQMVVVGLPVPVGNGIYNCAAVLNAGQIVGIVPKRFLPTYKEFYERRWFQGADGREPPTLPAGRGSVPFGIDLLFEAPAVLVGIEICEDLWMPIPPSSFQAVAGATILLNLSASNETVAKGDYRSSLVLGQSGRCIAAYAYASAGPTESTSDVVMGGDLLIAENGTLLRRSQRVGAGHARPLKSNLVAVEVDVQKLRFDRHVTTSFGECCAATMSYRRLPLELGQAGAEIDGRLIRRYNGGPFVPQDPGKLAERCAEVFDIQCHAVAKRFSVLSAGTRPVIGISGGLDSTLALLVVTQAWDFLGRPRKDIHAVTMPGFGTSDRTKGNANALMDELGVDKQEIDIRPGVFRDMADAGYQPFGIALAGLSGWQDLQREILKLPPEKRQDVGFENYQARKRAYHLFGKGFVIGTGDLSELALGWCTYNGDHMSNYNPNCSIPKTLVAWLVSYVAGQQTGAARKILESIVATKISPELLPTDENGEIAQSTEAVLGPYELHDFFLFHFIRNGFSPAKILFLAGQATFSQEYPAELVRRTLRTFITRFFFHQFKRDCVPNGPKVGSVSLSPRGDWRMPSDAEAELWLKELGEEED